MSEWVCVHIRRGNTVMYYECYQMPIKTKAFVSNMKMAFSTISGKCYEPACDCVVDWVPFDPVVEDSELLNGLFELHNTVYTLSILLSCSKNGIKSKSSVSVMSSNHDATGTYKHIK